MYRLNLDQLKSSKSDKIQEYKYNSSPFLELPKLKALLDNKPNLPKMMGFACDRVKNIVGQEEDAGS